ncbi:SH3 domain-containing protein [Massilia sp. CF038]|uniref:SH3 domain-containing protein n=1 Tax=Massilia sp. CF038 TaxID=1881045 RepID=UPI0009235D9B|nr:SH3 domain-containing protein [Massilia sp. CF038]SHG98858.1 SH3 domain-containing protein [Massilia sp. CF038]
MIHLSYLSIAAVAIALLVTLMLAAWLTPAHWWRQLNARALAVVGLGTWAIASLILWLAPATAPALAATPATTLSANARDAGRSYRVHEDLNLRSAIGTASSRIAVVPAGTMVTTTGVRQGDWWQVQARVDGKTVEGWSSSLWLRRANEGAAH